MNINYSFYIGSEYLLEFAALGLWVGGTIGSSIIKKGVDYSFNSLNINKLKYSRKLTKEFKNIIEDIKNNDSYNCDEDTIVELNRFKANVHSFRPVIDDYSHLDKLNPEERKKKVVDILTHELQENYTIPDLISNQLIIEFLDKSYEIYDQFAVFSDSEYRKNTHSTLKRIEDRINDLSNQKTFQSSEYVCSLKKQIEYLDKEILKIEGEVVLSKLKPYATYFHQAVNAEISNNPDRAKKFHDKILNRIEEDIEIYANDDYWDELNPKLMEYKCFASFNLSEYYLNVKDFQKSLKYREICISTAEEIDINCYFLSGNYSNYANLLLMLRRTEEAESIYKKAIQIKPEFYGLYSNYANLLFMLGRIEEAEDNYKRAIQIDPEYSGAYYNYGTFLALLRRTEEAESIYKKAIQIDPEFSELHNNYANLLFMLGRIEEAEDNYKRAIQIQPDYPDAHYNYATLLEKMRRTEEAEIYYKKAIQLNSGIPQIYYNYIILLLNLKRNKEAYEVYSEALEASPDLAIYPNLFLEN